jgi:hypothetical protein
VGCGRRGASYLERATMAVGRFGRLLSAMEQWIHIHICLYIYINLHLWPLLPSFLQ